LHKLIINSLYKNFENFTINIKDFFSSNKNTIHKARNEIKIINYDNTDTVVKSFKEPNIINKIAYTFFRDSKARKSYYNSLRVDDFVPTPLSYIEFYENTLLKDSYFISKKFDYDFTIREPLLDADFKNKDAIFKAFAIFTLQLHNNGIYHEDYSPGNILIKKEKKAFLFKIVDVNRMSFLTLSEKDRAKNFSKLWASDKILKIMATEYMQNFDCSDDFIKNVLYYSNKNKKIKNFKKRLKGKPVND